MWEMDEKCSWINCYRVGMKDEGVTYADTPSKMVSPDVTLEQLLRFLMLKIASSW